MDVLVSKCYCTLGKRYKMIVGTPHRKPGNPKGLTRVWKQDPDYKIAYITLVTIVANQITAFTDVPYRLMVKPSNFQTPYMEILEKKQ